MGLPDAKDLKELVSVLAPGLIILGIRQRVIAGPVPSLEERAVSYACVSALYYATVHPLILLAVKVWHLDDFVLKVLEYLLIPVLIGFSFALSTSKGWSSFFWKLLKMQPVHHIPTAWDYAFSTIPAGRFILVTLTDGSKVGGLYGEHSFASSSSGERDLLIAEVWEVKEGGWKLPVDKKSILLCGKDIRTVELFH